VVQKGGQRSGHHRAPSLQTIEEVCAVDELDILKQVTLFSHMDADELSSVRTLMGAHGYAPGQVILSRSAC
jgi:hypothetical protein